MHNLASRGDSHFQELEREKDNGADVRALVVASRAPGACVDSKPTRRRHGARRDDGSICVTAQGKILGLRFFGSGKKNRNPESGVRGGRIAKEGVRLTESRAGSSRGNIMLAYARMASRSYLEIEEPLRAGELVRLKSGGPVMVVKGEEGGVVQCSWHDKHGQVNAEGFPLQMVRRARRSFFGLRR